MGARPGPSCNDEAVGGQVWKRQRRLPSLQEVHHYQINGKTHVPRPAGARSRAPNAIFSLTVSAYVPPKSTPSFPPVRNPTSRRSSALMSAGMESSY